MGKPWNWGCRRTSSRRSGSAPVVSEANTRIASGDAPSRAVFAASSPEKAQTVCGRFAPSPRAPKAAYSALMTSRA